MRASHCSGLSCCRSKHVGSRHVGFRSHGTQTKLSCGTWDLPRPGMEPVSPASVGGFLTTGPPGKSPTSSILFKDCSSRLPVGLPGGNSEIKVGGMKYRLHSCSWSWSHLDSHPLFPPRSILDFPQLPPVQVSVDHITGPHHRKG